MGSALIVSCAGVSKAFEVFDEGAAWRVVLGRGGRRRVAALQEVSFSVRKGEFVGFLGANGAGKSTLLRTLAGVYHPDGGTIAIEGELAGLFELGITSHQELTGREYAERVLSLDGVGRRARADLVREVEAFSELGTRFEDPLFTYSAGMMARLFFATATARPHEVYLIDEILSVGDQHFQAKCWRRLRERLGRGASGVLATHDWSAVLKLCREAHVLSRGRIVHSGPADEVVRGYLGQTAVLPAIVEGVARFRGEVPQRVVWTAGVSARLPLEVELLRDGPVHFVFCVERMAPGRGWEVVIIGLDHPVGDRAGLYAVELEIPSLPLSPGRYSLDLNLVRVDPHDRVRRDLLDGRGWLKGTPIELVVEGAERAGDTVLPLQWVPAS
ncbi:MAG: ABC transporter ATP-binding protein [Rhodospirillaceae bacterium]|nr:ABC transporter ATP-binding protein [Rhodospirillaceae bacterium]